MSLTSKFTLFCLLLVSGTSWLVLGLCVSESNLALKDEIMASSDARARQLADALGPALVRDSSSGGAQGVYATLQRVLARSPHALAIYSVIYQDNRAVLIQEVCRDGEARTFGTPVNLSNAGHRAKRTKTVQSELISEAGADAIRTYAPILGEGRTFHGLVVTESGFPPRELIGPQTSTAFVISLLAGIISLGILIISIARPLERMQDQLVAKEDLTRALVRSPSDLLREVTLIIDKAHADRDCFESRLKQQSRQQESSIRKKDEVLANSVHELRTPLTSIIASLEILIDSGHMMTDDEMLEFMEQASTAARHMMFIVNDMLDAAALEFGQIAMEIEYCNLGQVLHDARRSMEIVATARRMSLVVEPIDPAIEVLADPARLMQVIFNLVSNAVKYTPAETSITLRGWPSLNSVIIEVEDQGTAIAVESRDKLFTKFSQLKSSTRKQNVDSTGIGLYLSKKIVELMGGSIGYRPSETGGSVFWFTLPLAPARAQPAIPAGAAQPAAAQPAPGPDAG